MPRLCTLVLLHAVEDLSELWSWLHVRPGFQMSLNSGQVLRAEM